MGAGRGELCSLGERAMRGLLHRGQPRRGGGPTRDACGMQQPAGLYSRLPGPW